MDGEKCAHPFWRATDVTAAAAAEVAAHCAAWMRRDASTRASCARRSLALGKPGSWAKAAITDGLATPAGPPRAEQSGPTRRRGASTEAASNA